MTQKTNNSATPLTTAINTAYQLSRPHVANRGVGAMGLVLSSGGSEHAAISALLYGAVTQQLAAAPDKATADKAAVIHQVTAALPDSLSTQIDAILTELLALTGLSAEGQVLQLPRQLSADSSVTAAALLLVDVASFVTDARQIGDKSASRYVLTPGSAAAFRPTAGNINGAAGIIRLYDGLARQLIKTHRQATVALGHRALTLLYSLDEPAVDELKAWYQADDSHPIFILAQADQPEVEAAPVPAA